jgi:GNAT superfamily N-acetyltransferase
VIVYTNEISVDDYTMLRNSAGWPEIPRDQAQAGLNGSAFIIAAKDGGKTIGMTRLISDGGYFYIVVDVVVLPEYQGRGLGREMMSRAVQHIKNSMQPGHKTYTLLSCRDERQGFYEKMGFQRVCGMHMRII